MASIPLAIRSLPRQFSMRRRPSPNIRKQSPSTTTATTRHLSNNINDNTNSTNNTNRPKISWLDLRGTGLSAIERLALEELLLRHDPQERCWGIVGVHEPTANRVLHVSLPSHTDADADDDGGGGDDGHNDDWTTQRNKRIAASTASPTSNTNRQQLTTNNNDDNDAYGHERYGLNRSCAIIMGIGGKPHRLIDIQSAKNDGILVLKRFSGGGTVVVDHSSLWTTFIGRTALLPHVTPYPREIMEWSADAIFGPAFDRWNREILSDDDDDDDDAVVGSRRGRNGRENGRQTLVFQGKSCGISGGVGESLVLPPTEEEIQQQSTPENPSTTTATATATTTTLPTFRLRENDYVLGERKIGGNAQSIISGGFLHHTSFLWDWDPANMDYLTLPEKRPRYRGDRSHDEFLVKLKDHYGEYSGKNALFGHVKDATGESFELEEATLRDVMEIANERFGGLQAWFDGKCRTKVVKL